MKKLDFNAGWSCRCLTRAEDAYPVTLSHDAMRTEPRANHSAGGGNSRWYSGTGIYRPVWLYLGGRTTPRQRRPGADAGLPNGEN